jgi:enoyl-CoA hydratase/carnithine racemase
MAEPILKVTVHAPAGTIILNRPEKRNALSRAMLQDLVTAFDDLHGEKRVRGVILTGSGSAFSSGMDLSEMLETAKKERAEAHIEWYEDSMRYREVLEKMWRFPKPIIAAVNGPALAGGAGLVLASDVVVAADNATIGFPEPLRGIVAGMVAPYLAFRVGGAHAARMLLLAHSLDAAEAHRIGLFSELVRPDKVWARASELVKQCSLSAPEAMQLTKRMINETIGEQVLTLLAAGAAVSATSRTTEAAHEGLAAFIEKREPKWP